MEIKSLLKINSSKHKIHNSIPWTTFLVFSEPWSCCYDENASILIFIYINKHTEYDCIIDWHHILD